MMDLFTLNWRDVVEILFFSSLFYYASLWLKKDSQKNLVPAFYAYCSIAFISHTLGLSTISSFLFMYGPPIIMLFIIVHQKMLQKNFVGLHTIQPAQVANNNWVETTTRVLLKALNNNQSISCIIERNDALDELLANPLQFNTLVDEKSLTMLINSNIFDSDKMIWLDKKGTLRAINSSYHQAIRHQWFMQEKENHGTWKYDALLFTTNTDALILNTDPLTREFTLVAQGKALAQLNADQAQKIITQYFNSGKKKKLKKGRIGYGTLSPDQKRFIDQPSA